MTSCLWGLQIKTDDHFLSSIWSTRNFHTNKHCNRHIWSKIKFLLDLYSVSMADFSPLTKWAVIRVHWRPLQAAKMPTGCFLTKVTLRLQAQTPKSVFFAHMRLKSDFLLTSKILAFSSSLSAHELVSCHHTSAAEVLLVLSLVQDGNQFTSDVGHIQKTMWAANDRNWIWAWHRNWALKLAVWA